MITVFILNNVSSLEAFVVRLLTRRFIGDYDPNLERSYSVNTVMDNDHFMLEVLDSGGHHLEVDTIVSVIIHHSEYFRHTSYLLIYILLSALFFQHFWQ